MGALIDFRVEVTWEQCCVCGIEFSSPVLKYRRNDGKSFWCPNGHSQSYHETEAVRLQKALEAEQKRTAIERQMRFDAEAGKAKLERKLRRVDRGVCPECNRSFANVARHMECKHKKVTA